MASERDDDLLDIISEALDESMDVDWTSRDGARHVLGALQIGGYLATPPPASADALGEVERVAQCLQDHMGDNHGISLRASEWDAAATAALSAMSPAGEVKRLATAVENYIHQGSRECELFTEMGNALIAYRTQGGPRHD